MVLKRLIGASVVGLAAIVSSGCEELNSNNIDGTLVSVKSDAQESRVEDKQKQYPSHYSKDENERLKEAGISSARVRQLEDLFLFKYENSIRPDLMIEFKQKGINYDVLESYLKIGFSKTDIIPLETSIGFDLAKEYGSSIGVKNILKLHELGKTPKFVHSYHSSLLHYDFLKLVEENIGPVEANRFGELNNRYGVSIDADDIVGYKAAGISYDQVEAHAKQIWLDKSLRE